MSADVNATIDEVLQRRQPNALDDSANVENPAETATEIARKLGIRFGSDAADTMNVLALREHVQRAVFLSAPERYTAAVNQQTHYSTMRGSLTLALITVGVGFTTYGIRYLADNSDHMTTSKWVALLFVLAVQLLFFLAAIVSGLYFSMLITRVHERLQKLDAGRVTSDDASLFYMLANHRIDWKLRDTWDRWLVGGTVFIQLSIVLVIVFIAIST